MRGFREPLDSAPSLTTSSGVRLLARKSASYPRPLLNTSRVLSLFLRRLFAPIGGHRRHPDLKRRLAILNCVKTTLIENNVRVPFGCTSCWIDAIGWLHRHWCFPTISSTHPLVSALAIEHPLCCTYILRNLIFVCSLSNDGGRGALPRFTRDNVRCLFFFIFRNLKFFILLLNPFTDRKFSCSLLQDISSSYSIRLSYPRLSMKRKRGNAVAFRMTEDLEVLARVPPPSQTNLTQCRLLGHFLKHLECIPSQLLGHKEVPVAISRAVSITCLEGYHIFHLCGPQILVPRSQNQTRSSDQDHGLIQRGLTIPVSGGCLAQGG